MAETKAHHKKSSFCASRPKYREARWERAVKVYTINLESKYLLVQGIPALGVTKDLLETFAIYGAIDEYRILDDYPAEEFTQVYWVKFKHIMAARKAKRKLDNRSFFGGILHVAYAPEFESVDDTREKLMDRKRLVERKIKNVGLEPRDEKPRQAPEQFPRRQEYGGLETNERHPGVAIGQETSDGAGGSAGGFSEGDAYVSYVPPWLPPPPVQIYSSQSSTFSSQWKHAHPSPSRTAQLYPQPQRMTQAIMDERSRRNQVDVVQVEGISSKGKETIHRHSVKETETVIQSDPSETLTGNPSIDRTVLSIRRKLNQIKHVDPLNFRAENPLTNTTPKRSLGEPEVVAKVEKKKQRKRI